MSLCINTQYGSMSCCGIAIPLTCGKVKAIKSKTIEDILLTSLPDSSKLDSSSENEIYLGWKEHVKLLNYFPSENTRFTQLIYLVHLLDHQSPYSESDCVIFEHSNKTDYYTKCWLRFAFIAIIVSSVASFTLNYIFETKITAPTFIAIAMFSGIVSWISTGSNPDFKSDAANERQDRLSQLPETFNQIAMTFIDLKNSHPNLAKKLATDLNLKKISNKMLDYDPKARSEMDIIINDLMSLEAAKDYVFDLPRSDRTPSIIRTYILLNDTNQSIKANQKNDECIIEITEEI